MWPEELRHLYLRTKTSISVLAVWTVQSASRCCDRLVETIETLKFQGTKSVKSETVQFFKPAAYRCRRLSAATPCMSVETKLGCRGWGNGVYQPSWFALGISGQGETNLVSLKGRWEYPDQGGSPPTGNIRSKPTLPLPPPSVEANSSWFWG